MSNRVVLLGHCRNIIRVSNFFLYSLLHDFNQVETSFTLLEKENIVCSSEVLRFSSVVEFATVGFLYSRCVCV